MALCDTLSPSSSPGDWACPVLTSGAQSASATAFLLCLVVLSPLLVWDLGNLKIPPSGLQCPQIFARWAPCLHSGLCLIPSLRGLSLTTAPKGLPLTSIWVFHHVTRGSLSHY